MRHLSRLFVRPLSFLLLAVFLLQLSAFVTVTAQTIEPNPSPADPPLPKMDFQPPANADKMEDFVPPGIELIRNNIPKAENAAFPLTPNKGNAIAFNQDRIGVIMEPETVPQATVLKFEELATSTTITEETELGKPEPAFSLHFQLETVDPGKANEVQKFERMSRIVVDMRHFGIDLDDVGGYFYLAYEDENEPGSWIEVPTDVYGHTGLISAEVSHFSNWQSGWRPEAWALDWQPPAVNEFTANASYQYPISIPPGRAGLQPNVGLSYSTSSLRGAVRKVSYGTVATGWSLSDINITRSGITNGSNSWTYPDTFRLTINGTGGRMIKGGTTSGVTTFYVEDMPNVQVLNYGGRTWSVESSGNTYWIVKDGSGTTYRLGYTDDSFSFQDVSFNDGNPSREVIAWHVDTITDAFGNQVNYTYTRPGRTDTFTCGIFCWWDSVTYNSQVTDIHYNFDGRITALPAAHNVGRLSSTTAASHIQFIYDTTEQRLSEIQIYHGSDSLPIRKYVISAQNIYINNPSNCDVYHANGAHTTLQTWTRVVDWIEEQGYDTVSGQWISLPRTNFTYSPYHQFTHLGSNCFQYRYMTAYENGYGGRVEFTYNYGWRPSEAYGTYGNCKGSAPCEASMWPSRGFSYRVSRMTVIDGQNNPVITNYSYDEVCYDQEQLYEPGSLCKQPETTGDWGNVGGYGEVTATTLDYDGVTPILIRKTIYHRELNKYGRPQQIDMMDGNSTLLTRTNNLYTVSTYSSYNVQFTYTNETTTEQYNNGIGTPSTSSKVRYEYDTGKQGGVQYGNLTSTYQYDNATAANNDFYREQRSWYAPKVDNGYWMVGYAFSDSLLDGNGSLIYSNYNYYDNTTNPGTPPTQGRLDRSSRGIAATCAEAGNPSGCIYARKLTDTFFAHDVYGNQTEITTYTDYGYRTFNSSWVQLHDLPPTNGRTTTITYDADYNLYPVSVKNDLLQETKFEVYGFKDSSGTLIGLPGFQSQTGLLKRVIDPNSVRTSYEYDPFGRLFAVYDESDLTGFADNDPWNGNPLTRYRYWDTTWNHSGTTTSPFAVTTEERPGDYPGPNNESKHATVQYYDGMGRVIQTRQRYMNVDGVGERDVLVVNNYNALGQVSCTSTPYTVLTTASTLTESDNCTSKDNTLTTYDALGRPSLTTAPDGTQTATIYGLNSTYSYNAESQIQAAFTDNFGRLTTVDENLANFTDEFNNAALPGWNTAGTVTVANGVANITGTGSGWTNHLSRSFSTSGDSAISFTFNSSDQNIETIFAMHYGSWATSNYRRWSLNLNANGAGTGIFLDEYEGSTSTKTFLMPFKAGTQYRAILRRSESSAYFSVLVWEVNNPANSAEIRLDKASGWKNSGWSFLLQVKSNTTLQFDDYQELYVNRTRYSYDLLDNLTNVTDAENNQTTITYDNFGRKTSMDDPDMGTWDYEYDAVGNLVRQEDANGNTLCFYYDELDRLQRRIKDSSPGDACPTYASSPGSGAYHLASYTYVSSGNGIGQIGSISWGPNQYLNNDTFSYDSLGRMDKQDRMISGRIFTMETLSYDSLHRPLQVQYPNGEIVTLTYDHEGANSLTAGTDSLISDIRYNARGQLEYVDRVHSWNLDTDFIYFGAAENFRLDELQNGSNTDNRPDFTYLYDDVGNITSIIAATSSNGTDSQTFTYDSLNRLVTATATGSVADYTHTYNYDEIGNITSTIRDSVTSTYGYHATKVHAVTSMGSYSFGYDANGNMTSRQDDSGSYSQLFDVENRLTVVNKDGSDGVTTFYYDAAGQRVRTIEPDGTIIYTPFPGYEEEVTSEGYHWALDEGSGTTASDSSFNGHDGTLQGPQWTTGYYGQALDFDGSNDYVQFDGTIDVIGGLTVSAWVRPEQLPTGLGRLVVSTYRYSNLTGWYLGDTWGDTDHFPFGVMDEAGVHRTVTYNGFFNQYLNQWVHVTGVFRPGEALELYINGQLAASSTSNIPDQITPSQNFKIGARADNTTQGHWDGQIDEVRIIPRALAATEISGLMSASLPASTGGTMLADMGSGAGANLLATDNSGEGAATVLGFAVVGSLLFLIPVGVGQYLQIPERRTRLKLIWKRHRVTVGKVISLVSLVGLLGNSVFLVPVVQAAPAAVPAFGPVQSPWVSADIGSVGVTGSADETSGTFTIDGAGADIAGTADAFHYVYQSLSGDGEIIANVASLTGGGSTPKAGLMIRESLTAGSAHVSAVVRGNRIRVLERATTGGSTTDLSGHNNGAPEWIRVERTGNTFDLYHSNTGSSWTLMSSRTVTMGTNVYIGMAVTGNSTTTLATGTFNNVTVTGGGGGPTATPTATSTATPTNTPTVTVPGPTATATTTSTPTPTPTTPPPASQPEVIVQRTTYSIAGQAVFLRIRTLEDGVEVSSDLYAMHTDHLGSTSTLSYLDPGQGTAGRVFDSRAFYEPFGDYRLPPTGDYTDRGYTGHLGNNSGSNDIGLIYMNARYYVPNTNRWLSPDTIVPNPANPQSFNRYSYVRNNPINFTDPTGHRECGSAYEASCMPTPSPTGKRIFYVNGLVGTEFQTIEPNVNSSNEYASTLGALEEAHGDVELIPAYTQGEGRLAMYQEAYGYKKPYANRVANVVERSLSFEYGTPLGPNEELILIGSSAGGTAIIESLAILEDKGIFVDQVILRGSYVRELKLTNVGQVDYIAADPPLADWHNYSRDINPFDGIEVNQHILTDFAYHSPNQAGREKRLEFQSQINELIIDLTLK